MTGRPREEAGPAPGRRLVGMLVITGLVFAALVARLTDVQVIATRRYQAYGQAELSHTVSLPALRGTIYDRSGGVLALSVPETTVIADDFQVADPVAEAQALAPILGTSQAGLVSLLSQRSGYVPVARQVSQQVAARIEALDLAGLTFASQAGRFLPNGSLALPLVGLVDAAGKGASGLEYMYNQTLTGHPGSAVVQQDASGRTLPGAPLSVKPAQPGHGLVLTLDRAIQYDAEQALAHEIVTSHAASGSAVVIDARSGGILALASLTAGTGPAGAPGPSAQPLALTQVYEPGSVAKLATFAGALARGVITPTQSFAVPSHLVVGGYTFTDAEAHPAETLTATQILAMSSNIGTIGIAQQLGPSALYAELRAIGLGQPTGLGFPGASPGILPPPAQWTGSTMGSMPIGQAESVTALQVADAYDMVANGGVWVPPRLVRATIGANGASHPVAPPGRHRVLSSTVAGELTGMLQQVTTGSGTAPAAAVPGYAVAGKTGTAQIPLTSGPGYQAGAFMASFVGFVPADRPALTIEVDLDHPSPDIYGGDIAAPVFSQIAQYALRRLDIPPTTTAAAGPLPAGAGPALPSTTIGQSSSGRPAP